MRRCPTLIGFVLTCSIFSGGCTEILSGGKEYYLDDDEGAASSGDPSVASCGEGLTACGATCVRVEADAKNCGACGHDCYGASCSAGMCATQPIAEHIAEPRALAVDDTYVYWTSAAGTVLRAPKDGGAVETIASDQDEPEALAIDGKHVFWLNAGDGSVMRGKKDGKGALKAIFEAGSGSFLSGLVLDDKNAYFSRKLADGDIRRAKKEEDDDDADMWIDHQPEPNHLAVTGQYLLWSGAIESSGGYVRYKSLLGGDAVALAEGEGDIVALATSGETAIWADGTTGRIRSADLAGNTVTLVEDAGARGLVADDKHVFWSTATGNVKSYERTTHETRVLAVDIGAAGAITTDETHVYILRTGTDGGILRVAK